MLKERFAYIKNKFFSKEIPLLMMASFLLWVFCFRGFLTGKLAIVSDAISYYDHIKFFIDNIAQGSFPSWDPHWNCGVPNEFFLRRFGSFNPAFMLIVIFRKIGINYFYSYFSFLSFYYFLGMIGFYKLTKLIFKKSVFAFASFLLLMFSSLGTRLFDSYILFFFVPIVWFFFFLFSFSLNPRKYSFLGMIFSAMIIVTTYIPFFFFNIFVTFLLCFIPFYFKEVKEMILNFISFVKRNKIFVLLCLILFGLSLLPGINLVLEGRNGGFVLPHRHYTSAESDTMKVGIETITSWGILEDIFYSNAFGDFKKFKFAILYIPFFAYILCLMGLFNCTSKRFFFLLLWGLILFVIHSPHLPVYPFLYEHIFYFKYFRNLHFFLWVALLPLFIIFSVEQLRGILSFNLNTKLKQILSVSLVIFFHVGLLGVLYFQKDTIASSYGVVFLSAIFFILLLIKKIDNKGLVFIFLLAVIVIEPIEVYHHLEENSEEKNYTYGYDKNLLEFKFRTREDTNIVLPEDVSARLSYSENRIYYSTKWFSFLDQNIYLAVLRRYYRHKFILYDDLKVVSNEDLNFREIEEFFLLDKNMAYISQKPKNFDVMDFNVRKTDIAPTSTPILGNSEQFQLLDYRSNFIKFKTNYSDKKFLVYNDSFHRGWKAFVNGGEVEILRANVAFKGLFLPPGENIVSFHFVGSGMKRYLNMLFLIIFQIVFWALVFFWVKEKRSVLRI